MICFDLLGFSSFENQTNNGFLPVHLKAFLSGQEAYALREILGRVNKAPKTMHPD